MPRKKRLGDLIILGAAGGWALNAAEMAEEGGWHVRALVNNLAPDRVRLVDSAYPIYQLVELPRDLKELPAFCALATPAYRRHLGEEAVGADITRFARLVHPSAHVSRSVQLGDGVFVGTMATIGPHVWVGNHAHLHGRAFVGHGTRIEEFAVVAPGAFVNSISVVREGAYLGMCA